MKPRLSDSARQQPGVNYRLKAVLSEAAGQVASLDSWGPCCDLEGAKERGIGVRAYLRPNLAMSQIALLAFPADTVTGARKFYAQRRLVQAFRDQGRVEIWQLKPSFRFGFWDATQIVEMTGGIDVDTYIALCTDAVLGRSRSRMERPGRLPPAEWDHYLRHLVALGIATDADRDRFHDHFVARGFTFADARPGLELSRAWAIGDAEALDGSDGLTHAVRGSFEVLAELCLT